MPSNINFNIGDIVEFELNPRHDGPRWECNTDQGWSKKYTMGVIENIDIYRISVLALLPGRGLGTYMVNFPNTQSTDYDSDQWIWPGYLKLYDTYAPPDCDCGNGNNSATHYMFCRRRQYIESYKDR